MPKIVFQLKSINYEDGYTFFSSFIKIHINNAVCSDEIEVRSIDYFTPV